MTAQEPQNKTHHSQIYDLFLQEFLAPLPESLKSMNAFNHFLIGH